MTYLLGIDVSTTATKALLIDDTGEVVAVAATAYDFDTPRSLWSEQDPTLWWNGAVRSIRAVLDQAAIDPKAIAGIGLTGQMHGLVLLDERGAVLRPALLWNDQRTGTQCDEIRRRLTRERLIQITGNDALTGFTAPKILWVREEEPEVYARIRHILLPKDYVRYRLTGSLATDRAGAAGTLLLDIRTRDWSDEVLEALEIPRAWLPPTHEGPEITGTISDEAARATGLAPGIPVVAGGGDQAAQAVGVGAVQEGVVALTLGTSGVVFASAREPFIEPRGRLHAFCHAVPGRWHLMGVMLSAAGSLRWYRDTLAPGIGFDDLLAPAADLPAGSEGLLFLPYLTGERTPHPDPLARGAFVGLTVRHTQPHLTRAVLEGVAFGLNDSFRLMQEAGLPRPEQVRVSGGGARSPLWRQILANVLDAELVTVNTTEGAAYGAALLAGVGGGVWPNVDAACDATVQITGSTAVQPDVAAAYAPFYETYRALYPALKPAFDRLGTR
ncbi:xylulokinase [Rhodothermaceae bacterium RA]|nr:xylulokinase [Rhodothermaceae bacterium RA]